MTLPMIMFNMGTSKSATIPSQDNSHAIYSIRQKCVINNIARSPVKTDTKERDCKSSTNFSTFPNRGGRSKGTNNKTFTIFDTFPEIENIVARISDCFSFPPREKNITPPAPTKYLNSLNLKSVNKLTAIDPSASPETNNVIYLTSIIKKHYSRNVINKMSESKNDTMGPDSKNVVNDMSKSESFMKGSVLHHSMGVIIPLTFA